MNLEAAFETFLAESKELLEEMEQLLLELENSEDGGEQLDALFRCVHTIKGSAGLFALDHVVDFTHVVETVMDRLRAAEIVLDRNLSAILLECRDHISHLVDVKAEEIPEDMTTEGERLLRALQPYEDDTDHESLPSTQPAAVGLDGEGVEREHQLVVSDTWHISIRFGRDTLRQGMDPAGFIRYLGTLGKICCLVTVADALPGGDEYDPEDCYLGFEIDFLTDVDKAAIEEVFEFVQDDCQLHILPPRSELQRYMTLIEELPEDDAKLGEMLVASGALTRRELETGLSRQRDGTAFEGQNSAPIGELLIEEGAVQPEVVKAALGKQRQVRETKARASQYIRVQADKLDSLINLVGELVIASAAAGLSAQRNGDSATQEAAAAVSALVEEIRDGSLDLRMVPIGETFQRFQRVVRDVSRELNKDIELDISGAETELDKTVVEKITDPLTHLVRNAIDHGIECHTDRVRLSKPPQGRVFLNAYHEAGSIVIEVSDDGGGLNRDKIHQKAIARGLVNEDAELSDSEIFNLIFEPGFSTADAVTNLSGRGVGMDVVKRNIEALRGTVEVNSTPGVGSTFKIRLPLTLAIIDGFLTGVAEDRYVVPLESVVECVELNNEQRRETRHRNFVNLRGEVLPVIRLRDHFGLAGEAGRRENIVVVKHGTQKAGLIVDALMGECQTVIKPLGRLFANLSGISGSTILGSGEVALILDVPSLVQGAVEQESATTHTRGAGSTTSLTNNHTTKPSATLPDVQQ